MKKDSDLLMDTPSTGGSTSSPSTDSAHSTSSGQGKDSSARSVWNAANVEQGGEKEGMEADHALVFRVEQWTNGACNHRSASLIATYMSALHFYRNTGDADFREIAKEAERALRGHLVDLQLKQGVHSCRHWE